MPVAGGLCVSPLGWPAAYYVNAVTTAILFTIFVIYFRDAPTDHSYVGPAELHKVEQGK
uniref:Major facilitator superfamily (MFS) profile domain-containing protein n=1 Tax=Plectus sambesii TaxID=2011161 RepID=A0A914VZE9_9BILA